MAFFKKGSTDEDGEKGRKLRLTLILAGAVAGILLLLLGSGNLFSSKKTAAEKVTTVSPQEELEQYQSYLEERIRALCESVNGVSNVTATVTLSGSFETVYATETVDGNEEYVIIGSGSSATALYLSRIAPQIGGIGIVCTGGGNDVLRRELTSLLTATFRVPSNRIYITEAKSQNLFS